ncbi:MAG: metalloregulator ArsR/SmtB family transcription factor, partial [Rhodospirillaceae bacterium]|nr:metalloregulator ArsR/SmtB family transcription factor [Rhodospirillaceae bacterium]
MDALVNVLKAAAEPTRLRLLALCARADLTVSDLTEILGQSQPRVSRHLKLLCEAGLLERHREGIWAYFRLAAHGPHATLARRLVEAVPDSDPVPALDLQRLETLMRDRATRAAAYFRRNAAQWDRLRALYVDEAEVERRLIELCPAGVGTLLDIGTGTGRILEVLGPRVERALGIDLSRDMLLVARSKIERAGLRNCIVRQADMYKLPLPGGSVDLVTIHQVLHFAERPAAVLAEAARVMAPGGRLVVVDFAGHNLAALREEHAHRWLGFDDAEIDGWLAAAGLDAAPPVALPGRPLTVKIWQARRAGA